LKLPEEVECVGVLLAVTWRLPAMAAPAVAVARGRRFFQKVTPVEIDEVRHGPILT